VSALVEIRNSLVHPQRVSAIVVTPVGTALPKSALVDDDGHAMKLLDTYSRPKRDGGYAYEGTDRTADDDLASWEDVPPPSWWVTVLLTGGGSVFVKSIESTSWLDDYREKARLHAVSVRDSVAEQLGLGA
jgi:hypothetical protein